MTAKLNPMLHEDFVFSSLSCEPFVPYAAQAAGLPEADRSNSWYGEGGPAAYQLGYTHKGTLPEEVFVFDLAGMTGEATASRFLRWAAVDSRSRLIIAARSFRPEFLEDLHEIHRGPLHFLIISEGDKPWFAPIEEKIWTFTLHLDRQLTPDEANELDTCSEPLFATGAVSYTIDGPGTSELYCDVEATCKAEAIKSVTQALKRIAPDIKHVRTDT